jgi:hypothetical protein
MEDDGTFVQGHRNVKKTMERLGRVIECMFSLFYRVYNRVEFPQAFHLRGHPII